MAETNVIDGEMVVIPKRERSIMDLIALCHERGDDPEKLHRLYDLYERETKRQAEIAFNRALAECQAEMPVVVRDDENKGTHSPFASLDNVVKTCKPTWLHFGFTLSFADGECPNPLLKRTICDMRHSAGHSIRYHVDLPPDGIGPNGTPIGAMNPIQGHVSSGSYGQRILTCRIFNITIANTDVDGQNLADMLGIRDEQKRELDDLIEQNHIEVPRLLAWINNCPVSEVANRGHTLASLTQKQFRKIVSTYRQKKGAV